MREDYFLMPIPPTPNGRLHLGHIAGPYLRMDMLARHLRSCGHAVKIISATDDFDSYVLWKALQEARTPDEVCRDYNCQIERDLSALDIEMVDFSNVVSGPRANVHASGSRAMVDRLVAQGSTVSVTERVLYSPSTDRYIVGAWLVGRCPNCAASAAGYFCEACGSHFKPGAMQEPKARLGDSPLEWREVESLFLRISNVERLIQHIGTVGVSAAFIDVINRYVASEGPFFRLTAPGTWGVSWTPDRFGNSRVLFEGGWEYALSCGDYYARSMGQQDNPFSTKSRVKTVVSFGIDNAILLLFGSTGLMMELPDYKPFDHVLVNYFFNLQGSKFSTSRHHVIWAGDIVEKTEATSDAVRYFLAQKSPEQGTTNFDVDEFVSCVNDTLVTKLQTLVFAALRSLEGSPPPISAEARKRIKTAINRQQKAFDLRGVSLTQAVRIIEDWVKQRHDAAKPSEEYWWLQGLAFLTTPVMPRFSSNLWSALGLDGLPTLKALHKGSFPSSWQGPRPFQPLSRRTLAPCLPADLTVAAAE